MASKTLIRQKKAELVQTYGASKANTGKTEVQVALLTHRINDLNQHFEKFPKDYHSRLGLMRLVGTRRRLLKYLRQENPTRYTEALKSLNLRK